MGFDRVRLNMDISMEHLMAVLRVLLPKSIMFSAGFNKSSPL